MTHQRQLCDFHIHTALQHSVKLVTDTAELTCSSDTPCTPQLTFCWMLWHLQACRNYQQTDVIVHSPGFGLSCCPCQTDSVSIWLQFRSIYASCCINIQLLSCIGRSLLVNFRRSDCVVCHHETAFD